MFNMNEWIIKRNTDVTGQIIPQSSVTGQNIPPAGLYPGILWPRPSIPRGVHVLWQRPIHTPSGHNIPLYNLARAALSPCRIRAGSNLSGWNPVIVWPRPGYILRGMKCPTISYVRGVTLGQTLPGQNMPHLHIKLINIYFLVFNHGRRTACLAVCHPLIRRSARE